MRVGGVGLGQDVAAWTQRDDGVDLSVDRLDAVEEGRHHLAHRKLFFTDRPGEIHGAHAADVAGRRNGVTAIWTFIAHVRHRPG